MIRNLISESTEDIFSKLTKSEIKKYRTTNLIPQFKENGFYAKFDRVNKINFKKMMFDKEKELTKLSSYKISVINLKHEISKMSEGSQKTTHILKKLDIDQVVREILRDFLSSYFDKQNLKKIDPEKFAKTFTKLKQYIKNEIDTVFCFVTMRNFDSKIKSMKLPRNQIIRPRTNEEFTVICDKKDDLNPRITPNFQPIKFILGTHISKAKIDVKEIKKQFELILSALKILHEGYIQFGGVYYRDSEDWEIKPTTCISAEPIISKTTTNYRLEYGGSTQGEFNKLVNELTDLNLTKGKYVFLGRSIERFSQAIENDSDLNRVVDFIICLESLYSSKELELSHRFAMRVASVLGQTPKEKIKIEELMRQLYNLRSKIVHGDTIPDIVLDEKVIGSEDDMDQCLKILENISRNSIKLFLQLINDYESKEELQKMIDHSIYEPKLQKLFLKNLKKIKFELEIN